MKRHELFSREWCELVFFERNKAYGAYVLRRHLGRRYRIALSWVFGSVVFLVGALLGAKAYVLYMLHEEFGRFAPVPPTIERMEALEGYEFARLDPPKPAVAEPSASVGKEEEFTAPEIVEKEDVRLEITLPSPEEGELAAREIEELLAMREMTAEREAPPTPGQLDAVKVVEQMPEFPGGLAALMRWLDRTIVYPRKSLEDKVEGEVVVTFLVDSVGRVEAPEIVTSLDPLVDRAVLSAIKRMPLWRPARKGTELTVVRMTLPIQFSLD